jgi:hypothetical protein
MIELYDKKECILLSNKDNLLRRYLMTNNIFYHSKVNKSQGKDCEAQRRVKNDEICLRTKNYP